MKNIKAYYIAKDEGRRGEFDADEIKWEIYEVIDGKERHIQLPEFKKLGLDIEHIIKMR